MARSALRSTALDIWRAGVDAVRGDAAVRAAVRVRGKALHVGEAEYALARLGRIVVVGGGKAGAAMARGLEESLGRKLLVEKSVTGVVNVLDAQVAALTAVKLHGARNKPDNNPTAAGVTGTLRMLDLVRAAEPNDLVICLISGGGSALLPAPADGITLADKQKTTRLLHAAGATINEMNAVRKHLSASKGGQLAELCRAHLATLVISDVVGDPLDVIASGPTVPDPSTFADALAALERHRLTARVPARVLARLQLGASGAIPETPKKLGGRVTTTVIASNRMALDAARREAGRYGYRVVDLGGFVQGEAASWGANLAGLVRSVNAHGKPGASPVCILAGGETTVTLGASSGKGGRNQEIALAALVALGEHGLHDAVVLSGGTDGEDGPTDAAGALADASVARRGITRKLDARDALARHDAYPFFDATDGLIRTGATHTNVMDLQVVLVGTPD